jgi:hypothetical protein
MTKTELLQFLVLMIPTFLILVAGAVSMADLAHPALTVEASVIVTDEPVRPAPVVWDDWLALQFALAPDSL